MKLVRVTGAWGWLGNDEHPVLLNVESIVLVDDGLGGTIGLTLANGGRLYVKRAVWRDIMRATGARMPPKPASK